MKNEWPEVKFPELGFLYELSGYLSTMYSIINLDQWPRRHTFEFYKAFEDPFYNITANVDVTKLVRRSKAGDFNFFAAAMYCSLKTVNELEALKLRIVENEVRQYDQIHGGTTVLRPDQTFTFSYFKFDQDEEVFMNEMLKQLALSKEGNNFNPAKEQQNLIHYSSIPWVSFTQMKHARRIPAQDSIPKLVFGKYFLQQENYLMPFSVSVHHALVDGVEVGKYFENFQKNIDGVSGRKS